MKKKPVFLNVSMDDVSCESDWFQIYIDSYLRGHCNLLKIIDNNHNVNNSRYHLIFGSCADIMGYHVFDPWLLLLLTSFNKYDIAMWYNKGNMIMETISVCLLVFRGGISNPIHITSEAYEHVNVRYCMGKREFVVLEILQMEEKIEAGVKYIYGINLRVGSDSKIGYEDTMVEFVEAFKSSLEDRGK